MTKTRRSTLIVFVIQIIMICGLGVFFETLKEVISHNPVVNSLILAVLISSIVYSIFAAVVVFRGESTWTRIAVNPASPNALKTVAKHFPDVGHAEAAHRHSAIEALNEALEWRGRMLDYASGVLIGLGLLGTFVGLMHTMAGIKDAMALVSGAGGKASASALIGGLTAPLAGMSTAFSASLLGLIGSLAVGALAQFISRSSSNWIESIREWATVVGGDESTGDAAPATGGNNNAAMVRIEHVASAIEARIAQLVDVTSAGRKEQDRLAAASFDALNRMANLAERQEVLLGGIQHSLQANTVAMESAKEAVITMAASVEANRVQVTAAVDSVTDVLVDIKTNTEHTVAGLEAFQSSLATKHAALEKMSVSVQMQRNAVMDCVEQISRARVAIESGRVRAPGSAVAMAEAA
ncbi:MotA/TolQ/ExbB proton channel family protein [Burkholderia sp. Leaf177]|uniref:MotA/TolQ/ExbB proton channel family protein n=1 Tax=Burkholderia sp. Leaf177 TaxID=1736287 RepID=UPI000AB494F2|nr:MotA/TolQ/ExbB proton channel family protein [Burkholderia sp. Leaf177]